MHYLGVATLEDLVDRYLVDGDEAAIEMVVRRTQPRLRRAARRIWPAAADDCVQTAYLSLMHKRGAGLDASIWPWLVTAVVRTAYRYRAQSQRRAEIAAQLTSAKGPVEPIRGLIHEEQARRLRHHVDRLPAKLRDAVVLYYLEGLTTRDTALLLDISEANVRVRLQRARALLRSRLPARFSAGIFLLPWMVADAKALIPNGVALKAAAAAAALCLMVLSLFLAKRETRQPARATVAASLPTFESRRSLSPASLFEPDSAEVTAQRSESRKALTGLVMNLDRVPVAGATIRWKSTHDGMTRMTRSRGDGRYRIEALPQQPAVAIVQAAAYAPLVVRVGGSGEQNFVLVAGATLRGTVVDDATGRPVEGARVQLWPDRHRDPVETRSALDGSFEFKHAPSGGFHNNTMQEQCRVGAIAPGRVSPAEVLPFAPDGGNAFVKLRLYRARTVTGQVKDHRGEPLGDVPVSLRTSDWPQHIHVLSDSDGHFRFERVPAMSGLVVSVIGDHQPIADRVTLVGRRKPCAEFLVVDAAGHPIAGALVGDTRTGFDGRCRVDAAGTMRTRMLVRARRFAPTLTPEFEPSETEPPLIRVEMHRGVAFTGYVRWSDGQPAREGVVIAREGPVTLTSASIAADGTFRFAHLPTDPCALVACSAAFLKPPVRTPAMRATNGITLTFPGARPVATRCEVQGTVRDAATGAPVSIFRAYVSNRGVHMAAPAEWRFGPLDAGTYRWFLIAEGYARYDGTITVAPGQSTLRVDIELDHASTVQGFVRHAPPGARIRLLDSRWEWGDETTIARDGSYRIRNVRPGRYLPVVFRFVNKKFTRLALGSFDAIDVGEGIIERDLEVVPGVRVDIVARGRPGEPLTLHRAGRLVAGAKGALADRRLGFAWRGWSAWTLSAGHYVARQGTVARKFEVVANTPMRVEMGEKK